MPFLLYKQLRTIAAHRAMFLNGNIATLVLGLGAINAAEFRFEMPIGIQPVWIELACEWKPPGFNEDIVAAANQCCAQIEHPRIPHDSCIEAIRARSVVQAHTRRPLCADRSQVLMARPEHAGIDLGAHAPPLFFCKDDLWRAESVVDGYCTSFGPSGNDLRCRENLLSHLRAQDQTARHEDGAERGISACDGQLRMEYPTSEIVNWDAEHKLQHIVLSVRSPPPGTMLYVKVDVSPNQQLPINLNLNGMIELIAGQRVFGFPQTDSSYEWGEALPQKYTPSHI